MHAERIIETILEWARGQPTIRALAVVGSHARGTARADSDIDLVLLTINPDFFRDDTTWLKDSIHWSACGACPCKWQDEDYGLLWSRRVWLDQNQGEIEIGFALPSWADVNPLEPGTQHVIADGCRILHDPDGLLARLCVAVAAVKRSSDPCCKT